MNLHGRGWIEKIETSVLSVELRGRLRCCSTGSLNIVLRRGQLGIMKRDGDMATGETARDADRRMVNRETDSVATTGQHVDFCWL